MGESASTMTSSCSRSIFRQRLPRLISRSAGVTTTVWRERGRSRAARRGVTPRDRTRCAYASSPTTNSRSRPRHVTRSELPTALQERDDTAGCRRTPSRRAPVIPAARASAASSRARVDPTPRPWWASATSKATSAAAPSRTRRAIPAGCGSSVDDSRRGRGGRASTRAKRCDLRSRTAAASRRRIAVSREREPRRCEQRGDRFRIAVSQWPDREPVYVARLHVPRVNACHGRYASLLRAIFLTWPVPAMQTVGSWSRTSASASSTASASRTRRLAKGRCSCSARSGSPTSRRSGTIPAPATFFEELAQHPSRRALRPTRGWALRPGASGASERSNLDSAGARYGDRRLRRRAGDRVRMLVRRPSRRRAWLLRAPDRVRKVVFFGELRLARLTSRRRRDARSSSLHA